jgi:hypothetical protein
MKIKFEDYKKVKDMIDYINNIDPEYWKMVDIADWKKVIEGYLNGSKYVNSDSDINHRDFFEQAQGRIYTKYDYDKILYFEDISHKLSMKLYDYFQSVWLDDKYDSFMPSDDGYTDLISSVVGLGKDFLIKCVKNADEFVEIARKEFYIENFFYLFSQSEKDYNEIRSKYDPLWGDTRKYNL